jgi:uncharacterized membrane protein YfcA
MSFFHFLPTLPPALALTFAIAGVLLLGISKSGFGGSVGILAIPLFAMAFGAQRGTALLLPILIAADTFSLLHHWRTWHTPTLKLLIPGTFAGIAVGSFLLYLLVTSPTAAATQAATSAPTARQSSATALNLLTGVICVLYVLLDQVRLRFAPRWHFRPTAKTGFAAGTAIGMISTLAHAAGPVAAIFLLNQGLPRATFLGTIVLYFFAINTTKLIPYALIPGLIDPASLLIGAAFLPLVPLGTWLGKVIASRLSESLFRTTILALTFLSGLRLIHDALRK